VGLGRGGACAGGSVAAGLAAAVPGSALAFVVGRARGDDGSDRTRSGWAGFESKAPLAAGGWSFPAALCRCWWAPGGDSVRPSAAHGRDRAKEPTPLVTTVVIGARK
jgi:hypothetical protein